MKIIQKWIRKEKRKRLEQTLGPLAAYYGTFDEDSRLLSSRGQVEFLTTVRYVEKYLQKGMRILEIGTATGRYAHYFAQNGYTVDAVELVQSNIELFKKKTRPGEPVTVRQGNAGTDVPSVYPGRPEPSPLGSHSRDKERRHHFCRLLHGGCVSSAAWLWLRRDTEIYFPGKGG